MMKYWFELMSLYSFPRRIQISSPICPKIDPRADFDQFSKNQIFSKFSKSRPENLEPQKLRFRKFFQCLGTNGHPIAPKILKTRHSKFLKGLIQQRSTLGAKNRFFFDFFVINIFLPKNKKNRIRKIDLFDHFIP